MKNLSDLLLDLYRLTQNAPAAEFQARVMDKMRAVFNFDSALWATGGIGPGEGTPHAMFVYRQPPDMIENWGRIKPRDTLIMEAFTNLGKTLNAALGSDPEWQALFGADMRDHIKRYGLEHTLITMIETPIERLYTAIAIFRSDPEHPFTEAERRLKQDLMPHLAEAWDISRFGFVTFVRGNGIQSGHGRAICDSKGVLYNADRNFIDFVRSEWPDWNGPQLVPELVEVLSGHDPRRYTGRHTVILIERVNNVELLTARKKSAVDNLSSREQEVATLFANGADHRVIADTLHISPVTARNHLQRIYAKLGVSNKIEMARLMRGD